MVSYGKRLEGSGLICADDKSQSFCYLKLQFIATPHSRGENDRSSTSEGQ